MIGSYGRRIRSGARFPAALGGLSALACAILAVPSHAQTGSVHTSRLTVSVPRQGEYMVRLLPGKGAKDPHQLPSEFREAVTQVDYELDQLGEGPRIAIDNMSTGETAIRPLTGERAPKKGVLDLKEIDFDHQRELQVRVTYKDKPVTVARVELRPRDAAPRVGVLDPTMKGILSFSDVPLGRLRLSVIYGNKYTQTQDVELASARKPGPVVLDVAVANRTSTVDQVSPSPEQTPAKPEPAAAAPATPGAPAPRAGSGGLTGLLGTVLGLILGAGAIWLLYRWSTSGGMAATLQKAGIEVSGPPAETPAPTPWTPNAPPPPVVADTSRCQFCGEPRNAAGECACSTTASTTAGAAAGAAGASPRLIGNGGVYSGSIFAVGGAVTIGRDASCGIALPQDNSISRTHAALRQDANGFVIEDRGSSNGVFVNGVRITAERPLRSGDEIQIGNSRFRFEA